MEEIKRKCLLRESLIIRNFLIEIFYEKKLTIRWVVADAKRKGKMISEQQLGRYLNSGHTKGGLTSESVVWLCDRYKIELTIKARKKRLLKGDLC